jgi:hypothetical protein
MCDERPWITGCSDPGTMQLSVRVWAPEPTGVVEWLGATPRDGLRLSSYTLHNVEPDPEHRAGLAAFASDISASRCRVVVRGFRSATEDLTTAARRAREVARCLKQLGILAFASVAAGEASTLDRAVVIRVE